MKVVLAFLAQNQDRASNRCSGSYSKLVPGVCMNCHSPRSPAADPAARTNGAARCS